MATQYDPSTGTFIDDGVDDSPTGYTQPLTNSLNGSTQPPPLDTGYTAPLQKALAQTSAPQNPQSPGGQDGLALPNVDVDKIAGQVGAVGQPKPAEVPPLPAVQTPASVSTPPVVGAPPVPGAPNPAIATATHHTVLSPESQQAITQLDQATGRESAAQQALGETRGQAADVKSQGEQQLARMQAERQARIQDRVAKAQTDYDNRVKEYDQQYTKLKSMHETDFYADKSTGYKIDAAISIALGAISQAFGGKNVGAELIGKEIEAHAARQRNELTNQREIVEKAHVGLGGAKNEADRQSLLWETAAFDRAAADVQARAGQFGGPEERQKAAVISAQLEAKSAEKKALLLKMTGEQVVTDTGRQTEADRLAAIKAASDAKKKAKGAGGAAGGNADALGELLRGVPPNEVQAKYKLSDKALKTVLESAGKAPKAAVGGENNPLAVRLADGSVGGLAPSARVVKQMEDRDVQYDQAIESLEQLKASGDHIPIGSPLYDKAVLAVAATTQANASDKTTAHEAGTIKKYGLINQGAIDNVLGDMKRRQSQFRSQLAPLPGAAPAENPYVGAAKAAKEKLNGGTSDSAIPPGAVMGKKKSTGQRGYMLNGEFHALGG